VTSHDSIPSGKNKKIITVKSLAHSREESRTIKDNKAIFRKKKKRNWNSWELLRSGVSMGKGQL